jgi:hypothetical protein
VNSIVALPARPQRAVPTSSGTNPGDT